MPPELPEFVMGSYYYQRCCNLLQMHRPTKRGRCWSYELRQNKKLSCRREAARCFVFVCSQLQHTYSAVFLLLITAASDLLVHKILLWLGYPMVKNFRRYLYSFWRNSRTWQTHRQTDRRTDTAWQHRSRLWIASCGKNDVPVLYREIDQSRLQW